MVRDSEDRARLVAESSSQASRLPTPRSQTGSAHDSEKESDRQEVIKSEYQSDTEEHQDLRSVHRQAERWSSLANIRENLAKVRSTEITSWHERKIQEREPSRHGFYVPWTKPEIISVLGNAPKKYAAGYFQLKVGHGAVGRYLARIGRIETPECWWCREPVQTVEHLYIKCRRWRRERRKLIRELEKNRVTWQAQGQAEKRWMASLLANEKAIIPLIKFLKATEIGAREGARERETEWERKNDRAGEDLLG